MLDTFEFVLKISFFILSIVWIGKIMILRTDKQIVINPLLIAISAILVILPQNSNNLEIMGVTVQGIRVFLYALYSGVVIVGVYATKRKDGIF